MLTLWGHSRPIRCLAYSPDSRSLASGGDDHSVVLWDWQGGKKKVLRGHRAAVRALVFSANAKYMVTGGWDEKILCWSLGRRPGLQRDLPVERSIWSLAQASRDSSIIAGTHTGECLHLSSWTETSRQTIPAHSWPVNAVAISPDGRTLATGSHDCLIRLWSYDGPSLWRQEWQGRHQDWVRCLAFSPDGQTLASGGDDAVIRLWSVAEQRERAVLAGHGSSVRQVAFTPDGKTLLSAGWDETVRLWDVASAYQGRAFDWKLGRVHALSVAPDGMTAAAAGDHPMIVVWDLD